MKRECIIINGSDWGAYWFGLNVSLSLFVCCFFFYFVLFYFNEVIINGWSYCWPGINEQSFVNRLRTSWFIVCLFVCQFVLPQTLTMSLWLNVYSTVFIFGMHITPTNAHTWHRCWSPCGTELDAVTPDDPRFTITSCSSFKTIEHLPSSK